MRAFIKGISTLLLALTFLLGVFFLPSEQFKMIKDSLDFFSKTDSAALDFGYYLLNRTANAAVFIGLTILITVATKRAIQNRNKED
jgi:heme/copper-type cytochrome/quinol oxidase subunit 3